MKHVLPSLRVWLALAAVATAAAFLLSYRSVLQSEVSTAAVEHTQQTLSALVALEGTIADLIFASGDDAITRATAAALTRVDDLAGLTLDNPPQQQRLNRSARRDCCVEQDTSSWSWRRDRDSCGGCGTQSLSRTVRELRVEELQLLTRRVEAIDRTSQTLREYLDRPGSRLGRAARLGVGLVVRDERKRHQVEDVLRRANEDLDARVSARTAELHETLDREQQLRREAEANNRLKDEFLMTVSHELRTPLNSLLGWADMLRLGILPEVRRQRAAEAIFENAKLQAQLIADLLDTARILTGKLRIEPAFIDLGQIVQDAANMAAAAAAAKGIELKIEVDRHGCVFFGDSGRLQQIVWNLVSNAVKFTEQGTVCVRLSRSESDKSDEHRRDRYRHWDQSRISAVCLRSV